MAKDLKEQIEIMTHYLNGGEIEYTGKDDGYTSWRNCPNPTWDWFEFDYRIKEPEQKVTIEKWLMQNTIDKIYSIIESSDVDKYKHYEKVKLIESYEVEL